MIFDYTGPDDNRDKREFELSNGNKIYAERKDPYGFWELHLDKGQLPPTLQGKYTSFTQVKEAVQMYIERREEKKTLPPSKKEE